MLELIDQRHAVFADVLVGDLEAVDLEQPWTLPVPATIVADGRWVDPTGGSHGYCIDPEVWARDWTEWWNSDPFVEPGTYHRVATVSDSFSALRSHGSDVEINGPDLPFTRP